MKLSIYSYRGYLFQTISSRTNIDYILILFKDIFHAENIKYHNFNLVFSLFSLLCWMSLLEGWGVGGGGCWGKTLKIMIMVVNPINDFCSNKSIIINQSTLWEYSQQTEIGAMSDHHWVNDVLIQQWYSLDWSRMIIHRCSFLADRATSWFCPKAIGFSLPGFNKTGIIFHRIMEMARNFQETSITK